MKIRVLPRAFFEKIKGTQDESVVLDNSKVISINSSWGWDAEPPFSPELQNHRNLLILFFDDIVNEPETPEDLGRLILFAPAMAEQIMRFVDDGKCRSLFIAPPGYHAPAQWEKCSTGTSTGILSPIPKMTPTSRTTTAKFSPMR